MANFSIPASSHTAVVTGWTNPSNAFAIAADSVYATASPARNTDVSGDFGFLLGANDIPNTAVITSASLEVGWNTSTASNSASYLGIQGVKSGVLQGTATNDTALSLTTKATTLALTGVTYADLVAGAWAVRVVGHHDNAVGAITFNIDYVEMNIAYSFTASGSFTGNANVRQTFTGSFTANSNVQYAPLWVSPADGTLITSTTPLVFTSIVTPNNAHFHLQRDTSSTFNSGNLEEYKSYIDSGFEYYDSATSSWVAIGPTGMPAAKTGSNVRFTPTYAVTNTTKYRRVRQSTN